MENPQFKQTSNNHIKSKYQEQKQKQFVEKKQQQIEVGPNPKKMQKLQYHDLVLDNLPSADNYEISYMHRDVINNVLTSNKKNVIVTVSVDGHIKFWKKVFNLIQFIRNFKAHNGLITATTFDKNHDLLASTGIDRTLKVFDIVNCDLRIVIKLNFSPYDCEFIPQSQYDWFLFAISEEKTGRILIVDPNYAEKNTQMQDDQQIIKNCELLNSQNKERQEKKNKKEEQANYIVQTLNFHKHPIKSIKMNWKYQVCFSIDQRGFLEIWDPYTFDFPTNLKYSCKIQAEYLKLLSANSSPLSLSISPKGTYLVVVLKDRSIRVFNVLTGKNIATINQPLVSVVQAQQDLTNLLHMEENEYERKMILEKDIQTSKQMLYNPNVDFDETEEFLTYTSFHGLKFYSLSSKNVEKIIGTKQHERFLRVSVYQGQAMRNPAGSSNAQGERKGTDPTIYCTAFKKPRFYIFSRRQPDILESSGFVRDIINERPNKQQVMIQKLKEQCTKEKQVIIHTTLGDIHLELFVDDTPKTCENFIKLSKKGYYDGMIFHRVIKGFMIQTGCPKGDGTGGESIWGGQFPDQLCPQKHRFEKPYLLAMANKGPNTNGSQFFITVVPCPWLDNKHTIFGRVTKGVSAVIEINKLKTDKGEKPLMPIKIMSTRVLKPNNSE